MIRTNVIKYVYAIKTPLHVFRNKIVSAGSPIEAVGMG